MDKQGWRLTESELRGWLDQLLQEGKRVVAPVDRDGLKLHRPVSSADEVDLGPGKTRWSPKEFLFPRTESLYTYELRAEGPELKDPPLPEREQILVGVRSCAVMASRSLSSFSSAARVFSRPWAMFLPPNR